MTDFELRAVLSIRANASGEAEAKFAPAAARRRQKPWTAGTSRTEPEWRHGSANRLDAWRGAVFEFDRGASGLGEGHITLDFLFGIQYRLDSRQPLRLAGPGAENLAQLLQPLVFRKRRNEFRSIQNTDSPWLGREVTWLAIGIRGWSRNHWRGEKKTKKVITPQMTSYCQLPRCNPIESAF